MGKIKNILMEAIDLGEDPQYIMSQLIRHKRTQYETNCNTQEKKSSGQRFMEQSTVQTKERIQR